MVLNEQFSAPLSLLRRQNSYRCWAEAPEAEAISAATMAVEAIKALMCHLIVVPSRAGTIEHSESFLLLLVRPASQRNIS
jgi:hypothetical protein